MISGERNTILSNVTRFNTYNMYRYDARNLLISYIIAILFSFLVVGVGFYSIYHNGVVHGTSFSAYVTTTRNSEFDEMAKGHSLGALPLDKKVGGIKIRFGELYEGHANGGPGEIHLGFGFAENVGDIIRNKERYF